MKKRAKDVGERGLHPLLRAMQQASPAVRIHLMGHSFGCIVASAAIAGPSGAAPLPFPINSCVLVQGAMSIWSFTSSLPTSHETAGFFNNILVDKKISGPFVATRSDSDMAVGKLYPRAAGVAGQSPICFPALCRNWRVGHLWHTHRSQYYPIVRCRRLCLRSSSHL